jgi:DNA end-binding protein Ku
MLMTTLHWPDEIRSTAELDLGEEKYEFKPAELAMANQLVSAMTAEFDPSRYHDEYRQALEAVIEAKVEGKETVAVEAPEETGKLIDLMAALEASVNAAKEARESSGTKPVSVSEAKAAKEAKAAESKTTRRKASSRSGGSSEAEEEAPARPARKRKTA